MHIVLILIQICIFSHIRLLAVCPSFTVIIHNTLQSCLIKSGERTPITIYQSIIDQVLIVLRVLTMIIWCQFIEV